jgi:hypothetical protein
MFAFFDSRCLRMCQIIHLEFIVEFTDSLLHPYVYLVNLEFYLLREITFYSFFKLSLILIYLIRKLPHHLPRAKMMLQLLNLLICQHLKGIFFIKIRRHAVLCLLYSKIYKLPFDVCNFLFEIEHISLVVGLNFFDGASVRRAGWLPIFAEFAWRLTVFTVVVRVIVYSSMQLP